MLVAKPDYIQRTAVVWVVPMWSSAALGDSAHRPWDEPPVSDCVVYSGARALPLRMLGCPSFHCGIMACGKCCCALICLTRGHPMRLRCACPVERSVAFKVCFSVRANASFDALLAAPFVPGIKVRLGLFGVAFLAEHVPPQKGIESSISSKPNEARGAGAGAGRGAGAAACRWAGAGACESPSPPPGRLPSICMVSARISVA